jgi:hypothetical protein
LGPTEFVDLNQIKCVVGHIEDRGRWSIIDQSKLLSQCNGGLYVFGIALWAMPYWACLHILDNNFLLTTCNRHSRL